MDRPPAKCPRCGQLNAGDNAVCVICRTPLRAAAVSTASSQPALAQRTAASRRQHDDIIAQYIRWIGYSQWLVGLLPFALCSPIFVGAMAAGDLTGICTTGPLAAIGLLVLWQAPKVKAGLIRGDTWPNDIVIRAHLLIYVILGLMMFGALLLPGEGRSILLALLCFEPPLIMAIIINYYAHQEFEWTIGRRKKRRFFPLWTETYNHPLELRWYVFLMLVIGLLAGGGLAVYINKHAAAPPDEFGRLVGAGMVTLIVTLALAYGGWTNRAWARWLAIAVHGLLAILEILAIVNVLPAWHDTALVMIGPALFDFLILIWFRRHPEYFYR